MKISEIFYSLQGEGLLAGTPSVFIRLAGCPLRCRWCDTKYAWDQKAGKDYSIDEILTVIRQWPCKFVVITGGEPMISDELPALTEVLKINSKHITIETAGIVFVPDLACNLMSISPKLSNSGRKGWKSDVAVWNKLISSCNYQLKFVVDTKDDLTEIQQVIAKLHNVDSEKIMLMPQAKNRDEFLAKLPIVADLCRQTRFKFCSRLQVLLWNNKRAT